MNQGINLQLPRLMIGICTQQNTINALPAIQLNVNAFCFIETEYAREKEWSAGSLSVFLKNNIEIYNSIDLLHYENGRIDSIKEKILKRFLNYERGIIFNFGGGQKAQSIGVWEAFKERNNPLDIACYTDQQTHLIELWYWDNNKLASKSIPIDIDLHINDLLLIYGFIVKNKGALFYEKSNNKNVSNKILDLTIYSEFREYISLLYNLQEEAVKNEYSINEIKKWFEANGRLANELKKKLFQNIKTSYKEDCNKYLISEAEIISHALFGQLKYIRVDHFKYILGQLPKPMYSFSSASIKDLILKIFAGPQIEISFDALSKLLHEILPEIHKWPIYFEHLLANRISELLYLSNHTVVKAYMNVEVEKKNDKAEFDIVLITQHGTIYTLDAKTGEFGKKDEDARKLNLLKAAGIYSAFIPVYLFYPEDIGKEYLVKAVVNEVVKANLDNRLFLTFNDYSDINQEFVFNGINFILNPINNFLEILGLKVES